LELLKFYFINYKLVKSEKFACGKILIYVDIKNHIIKQLVSFCPADKILMNSVIYSFKL
jgi:hypothetical protein